VTNRTASNPLPIRSFRAPFGKYHTLCRAGPSDVIYDDEFTYYDYEKVQANLSPTEEESVFGPDPTFNRQDSDWSLCSVTAPWLSIDRYDSENGIFCEICEDKFWQGPTFTRNSIGNEIYSADPSSVPFMEVSDYDGDVQQEHKDLHTTYDPLAWKRGLPSHSRSTNLNEDKITEWIDSYMTQPYFNT
jgi:hypothetical protein